MKSVQAAAFGFPNPMLGLATYGAVVCVGAGLLCGARHRGWFWLGLNSRHALRSRLLLLADGPVALRDQRALPVVLPDLGGHPGDVLVGHRVHGPYGHPPRARPLRVFFAEFGWAPPALHTGVIGMLILTRWWEFWTG